MLSLKQTLLVSITLFLGLSLYWLFGATQTITNQKSEPELIFNDTRQPTPISADAPRHHANMVQPPKPLISSGAQHSIDEANRLMALESDEEKQMKMPQFLSDWASREPLIAYQWVNDQPINDETLHFRYVILKSFLKTDPEQAELLILDLPEGNVKMDLAVEYAQVLARENPNKALNLIENFSDGEQKQTLMQTVLDSWAHLDPRGALKYLSSSTSVSPELTAAFAKSLFNQIVFDDIPYWQYAIYQYPEPIQLAIAQGIVATLVQKDPNAARTWASGLPEGPLRERATQQYLDDAPKGNVTEVVQNGESMESDSIDIPRSNSR
jgi:hypothetical protein